MAEENMVLFRRIVAELTASGAPFALVDTERGGHIYRSYANMHRNLVALLAEIERRNSSADMYEFEGTRRTYGDVFRDAVSLAAALRAKGVGSGDRLGLAMRNLPQWFTAFIAAARIGAVATLLNSRAAPHEITAAAERVGCGVIIADDRCAQGLKAGGSRAEIITLDDMQAMIERGGPDDAPFDADPQAPAAIIFTSGTTGQPKGVTLTQQNICSMAENLKFLTEVGLSLAAAKHGVSTDVVRQTMPVPSLLMIFPMFHISGITNLLVAAQARGLVTFMRKWDPADAARLIERNKVTQLSGPSLVFSDLLDRPDVARELRSVHTVNVGGQATPLSTRARIARQLPHASIGGGWGTTECSGSVTIAPSMLLDEAPGSVGLVIPIADLKVVDADGQELPRMQTGEFWVRGINVMPGYWDDPAANGAAFDRDWYKTGDVGYLDDDGRVFIIDRKKDMIISAGENIFSAEIERVLSSSDDYVEVAVFGIPDDRLGEVAVAAMTPRPGAAVDAASVKALVGAHLAAYKVPAHVLFDFGPLPRNALGKVDKAAVRRKYLEEVAAKGG